MKQEHRSLCLPWCPWAHCLWEDRSNGMPVEPCHFLLGIRCTSHSPVLPACKPWRRWRTGTLSRVHFDPLRCHNVRAFCVSLCYRLTKRGKGGRVCAWWVVGRVVWNAFKVSCCVTFFPLGLQWNHACASNVLVLKEPFQTSFRQWKRVFLPDLRKQFLFGFVVESQLVNPFLLSFHAKHCIIWNRG